MAKRRNPRLSPEARRKRRIADAVRGFKKLLAESRLSSASKALEQNRFAMEARADHILADHVGDKHFAHGHRGHWRSVKDAFSGCGKTTWATEFLDAAAALGKSKRLRQHRACGQRRTAAHLLHEALLRQHEHGFSRLCFYLSWLCEELLPRVLRSPSETHLGKRMGLCWRVQILHHLIPSHLRDPPQQTRRRIPEDRRDFIRITRAILKNAGLRAGLLTIYFLYPTPVRATRGDRTKWRPVFHALNDVCLHWRNRRDDPFNRVKDLLAFNHEDFKHLTDKKLARALFRRVGLDFEPWCEQQGVDEDSEIRRLNRAMNSMRLRDPRTR